MTDPLGQSQVIPYLIGLTKYGYHFTILSCEKKNNFKKNHSYVKNLLDPYPIEWAPINYHKFPPIFSSVYDYYALCRKAKRLHLKKKFALVHTRPGVPTLVALWLKKQYGLKFLNDIRGFWADERVDGGMWNLKNPIFRSVYHFFKRHELECIEKADYNTCLTFKAKEEILSWKHQFITNVKLEVIPCSVDLELYDSESIDPISIRKLKSELGINKQDFIVSYLGSVGGWYLVDEMMEFCKCMLELIPASKFLFISPHRHKYILERASHFGIPANNIICYAARRHEVPSLLSLSTYSIFFIKKCYSKISSSPTKHGEIMAMGIPVITNEGVGDVSMIVKRYNSGIVLNAMNYKTFQETIIKIKSGLEFDKIRIREAAEEFYSLNNAIQNYLKVYRVILGQTTDCIT